MCANKFLIGGLIGVQVGSIVIIYLGQFQASLLLCLIFLRKDFAHTKTQVKSKQNNFSSLRSFYAPKLLPLLFFFVCLILFCWLVLVLFAFLYTRNILVKKINWFEIIVITSFTILLTVYSCHVTHAFQSESTLYSCLNVKELLARNRREI